MLYLKTALNYKHDVIRYTGIDTSLLSEVKSKFYKHVSYILLDGELLTTIDSTTAHNNHRIAEALNYPKKYPLQVEQDMYNDDLEYSKGVK